MIDRETQQKIKDAANIVEVVGDYVKLTRRGANYMGLCPFHNERTPSFSVSPRRNFCHCFSCKKGGSPVNFIMEKEGVGYNEALLILAKKYNIPVRERELTDEERERLSAREAMIVASEWAMNHFHSNLYETEEGRDIGLAYLYERGITDEAIKRFKLGYAIDRSDALVKAAKSSGYDLEVMKEIGLVGTSQNGHDYDKFRGRVIFPIRNSSGKPVAFGGRTLKGDLAKYINSPETALYKKSNELYGIFEAKSDIVRNDRVFLMEGYLDVIGSWQTGLRNCVASSGTALTESQIALLHRFTDNVTLIYDGDSAGIKAALRGIDMLLSQKMHVKVLLLPDGEDPDSFAAKHTAEEFLQYIEENQTDFMRYKIKTLLQGSDGNPHQMAAAANSVVASIACIPEEIERIAYIKECSRLLDIDEQVISRQVAMALLSRSEPDRRQYNPPPAQPSSGEKADSGQQTDSTSLQETASTFEPQEREIIKYCVRYAFLPVNPEDEEDTTNVLSLVEEEMDADSISFSHPGHARVFEILKSLRVPFEEAFARYSSTIEETLEHDRAEFRERMRSSGGSLQKLRHEEKAYLEQEETKRREMRKQFAISYSVDYLINHEEAQVREIANPLVAERHTLSSIYSKAGNEVVPEDRRLGELVPRALAELRSEILNREVQNLRKRVAEAISSDNREEQQRLLSQLSKTLYMRSRIAEGLGERIISPRK